MSTNRPLEGAKFTPIPPKQVIPKPPDLTILDEIEGKLWIGYQRLLSNRTSGEAIRSKRSLGEVVQITFSVIKEIRAEAMRKNLAGRPPIGM